MRILRFLWKGIVALCVLSFVACSGVRDSGNPVVLVPVLDQNGNERFIYYQFLTLPSPFRAEGEAARVYFNPQSSSNVITSSIAEPQLSRSGNVFVPKETNSGTVLATYMFYEKIMLYERRVLLESNIKWPRVIAVYKNVRDLPPGDEGNASYAGFPLDITSVLPFDDEGKVALSFNPGALGHEHMHAHFDAFVNSQLEVVQKARPEQIKIASDDCFEDDATYELKLLRAWNEGLADFYGAVSSELPTFMLKSIQPNKVRVVNALPQSMRSQKQMKACQFNADVDPYFQGAQLSRALYAVAANDEFPAIGLNADKLTKWERGARYVMHRLSEFRLAIQKQPKWVGNAPEYLDGVQPEFALCFFLKGVPLVNSLATVKLAFSDRIGGLAKCGSLQL